LLLVAPVIVGCAAVLRRAYVGGAVARDKGRSRVHRHDLAELGNQGLYLCSDLPRPLLAHNVVDGHLLLYPLRGVQPQQPRSSLEQAQQAINCRQVAAGRRSPERLL
jgi:hypothetical protein